ncbi:MAG: 5-aminolevulinate synthase [Sedimentitalea sp.]|nr:5-aminolevulinate synthase [Sedimentitalea sp.]
MGTELSYGLAVPLLVLTGIGYAVATAGMKLSTGDGWTSVALALVVGGLLVAVLAEITLLRSANLAVIYLAIIAIETLLVLVFAAMIGDTLSPPQLAGAGLVLGGMALVMH